MRLSRFLFRQLQQYWKQKESTSYGKRFTEWFADSYNGFRFQMLLLTGPVVIYPIGAILVNGPFLSKTFKWRYDVDDKLPDHLQKLVDEV
jgi:hypothetical protein